MSGNDGVRWSEVDTLFTRILGKPPAERMEYLSSFPDVEPALRRAVENLLRIHDEASSFLELPPIVPDEVIERLASGSAARNPGYGDAPAAVPGEQFGPWRIVEEIGHGGMATVYLVERAGGPYEQTAALKLLRRGLDTADILARFRAERQILSSLDHPGISRLLDGGTTGDGRPWLVMERVVGVPITTWCDEGSVPVERRLQLFIEVARAVHHAHTKLVVHRDLKPSNILVTVEGRVKLLDFGIAKILDPNRGDGLRTRTGRRALTPEYASPEQVRGDSVTTGTDVYQLGLLLHRLLTGAHPDEARGPSAYLAVDTPPTTMLPSQIAGRREPAVAAARATTPKSLARRLRGDLDAIVVMALQPAPDARYGSALAMAEDVERHLDGLPVRARPAGYGYRIRKMLRRNPWVTPVVVAACLLAALYAGTLVRHGRQLEVERNAARREAARASHVRDVLVGVFQGADPWSAEDPLRGQQHVDITDALAIGADKARAELSGDPLLQADLLSAIGAVYTGLGRPDRALPLLQEALAAERRVDAPASARLPVAVRLGRAYNLESRYDTAAAILSATLASAGSDDGLPDTLRVAAMIELGFAEKGLGYLAEAEEMLLGAVEALGTTYGTPDLRVRAYQALARLYPRLDRPEEAIEFARRALELVRRRFGDEHPETATALGLLAETRWKTTHGDFDRAIAEQERASRLLDTALGPRHPESLRARAVLAMMRLSAGQLADAEAGLRASIADYEEVFGRDDPSLAWPVENLAVVLFNAGRLDEAERTADRVTNLLQTTNPTHPLLPSAQILRCGISLSREAWGKAEFRCREALRMLAEVDIRGTPLAIVQCRLGQALVAQGRSEEAVPLFDAAIPDVWRSRMTIVPGYVRACHRFAGDAYAAVGRDEDAAGVRARAAGLSQRGLPGVTR